LLEPTGLSDDLSTPAARAAKNAIPTIPVVILAAGHPVDEGLVVSLARPGGNITGLTASTGDDELQKSSRAQSLVTCP
jgi:ABC-type uncharacterized transport system substrate-binding protein